MKYFRIAVASILWSGLLPFAPSFTNSLEAQETPALWSQCKRVIAENVRRLEATPNVKVTANSQFASLAVPYPDRSAKLDRRYVFALSGSGVVNVWQSDDLMAAITRKIVDGCYGTAAVSFARDRTGDFATVGLFPDGSIKKFTCGADFDLRTRTRTPLVWGEQPCDL